MKAVRGMLWTPPHSIVGLEAVNGTHHVSLALCILNSPYLQRPADLWLLNISMAKTHSRGV